MYEHIIAIQHLSLLRRGEFRALQESSEDAHLAAKLCNLLLQGLNLELQLVWARIKHRKH
jgi:hypothetical protein